MLKKILKLNKKAFTLVEILLAVALTALASIAIGAIIISTQNNTTKLLGETELHQQITEVKDAVHNDILATNVGIKFWVKDDDNAYVHTLVDKNNSSEKVLALYNLDQEDYIMTGTYYRYDANEKTLYKAQVEFDDGTVQKDSTKKNTIEVDKNIGTRIRELEAKNEWTLIATNLITFNIDLTKYDGQELISFAMATEEEKSNHAKDDTIYLRNDININDNLEIDKYHAIKLAKPTLEGVLFTYDGEIHGPSEVNYDEQLARYIVRSADSTLNEKNAGVYYVRYSLKNSVTSTWADGSTSDIILQWEIKPREIGLVWGETEWVYDGKEHQTSCVPTNVVKDDDCGLVLVNDTLGPDIGTKICTATVNNQNYVVPSVYEAELKIVPSLPSVDINVANKTYNYEYQSMVKYENLVGGTLRFYISKLAAAPSEEQMTETTCVAKDAGSYHIWYQLIAKNNDYINSDVIYLGKAQMARLNTAKFWVENSVYDGTSHTGAKGEYAYLSGVLEAVNAGSYVAKAVPDENHAWDDNEVDERTLTWKIEKADIEVTPPTPCGLVYNGEYQTLCEPGSTVYGTMVYKLDNGEWDTQLPVALNAGDYKVYYRSTGDDNHNGTAEDAYITVTINRQPSARIEAQNVDYTGSTVTGVKEQNHVILSGDPSAIEAGDYKFTAVPESNYAWSDGKFDAVEMPWTIRPITMEVTPPTARQLVYNGAEQTLILEGKAPFGKMMYKLEGGEWSEELPMAIDAGDYNVYYYGVGDNNHLPTSKDVYITVTIARKPTASAAPSNKTYNGEEQCGVEGMNVLWDGDTVGTDVGYYTAYATPDSNHAWSDNTFEQKEITWEMLRAPIATASPLDITYTGEEQTGVEGSFVEWSGTYKATDAGDYIAIATPDSNHAWADGTIEAVKVEWTIKRAKGSYIYSTNRTYNEEEQNGYSDYQYLSNWSGDYKATNAGTYSFSVSPDSNHLWDDSSTDEIRTFSWNMARATGAYITKTDQTYNGSAQNGYSDSKFVTFVSGDSSATDAGVYTYKVTPDKNHVWADDETTDEKEFTWTMNRAKGASVVPANRTYDGNSQNGYSSYANCTLSGDYSATNANNYSFYATPDSNYTWDDGSIERKPFEWTMYRYNGASAWSGGTFNYTGGWHAGVSGNNVSWSGTTSAYAPGTYYAYATPTGNYAWADNGGTETRTYVWYIQGYTYTIGSVVYSNSSTYTWSQASNARANNSTGRTFRGAGYTRYIIRFHNGSAVTSGTFTRDNSNTHAMALASYSTTNINACLYWGRMDQWDR